MSEEIKEGDSWFQVMCECPYCKGVMEANNEYGGTEICLACNREFTIERPE